MTSDRLSGTLVLALSQGKSKARNGVVTGWYWSRITKGKLEEVVKERSQGKYSKEAVRLIVNRLLSRNKLSKIIAYYYKAIAKQ